MTNWIYYPKSDEIPDHLKKVVDAFKLKHQYIKSPEKTLKSNEVLSCVSEDLENIGYIVEKSKKKEEKIHIPVLFGRNGNLERAFEADAYNEKQKTVIEVEAGRAVMNFQFLKDLFQACVMHNTDYLVIAVRNRYGNRNDFEYIESFFETLYSSGRLVLPLKGILLIGY